MVKRFKRRRLKAILGSLAAAATATGVVAMPPFGSWSAPANLESLPGSSSSVNTTFVDGCASHAKGGLEIYFNSNRAGSQDIFVARRASTSEGFGAPVRLPAPVNTSSAEACPTIVNGNRLYFSSDRDDPAYDLYVSKLGPKGWSAPVRLGPNINTNGNLEETPTFYEDDQGREVMIFTRRSPSSGLAGAGGKLYQSIDGGPASLVQGGPHSSAGDNRASVTHDGRTIFWDSVRGGNPDLYYATRSSTSQQWGEAIRLADLSSTALDLRPFVNWDGTLLTFSSNRPGSESTLPDMWFATRARAVGKAR